MLSFIQRHARLRASLLIEPVGTPAVFLLCNYRNSHASACQLYEDSFPWVHAYLLPQDNYLGSVYFYNLLGHVVTHLKNSSFLWVGSLQYEDSSKTLDDLVLLESLWSNSTIIDKDIQVISLSHSTKYDGLTHAENSHPGLTRLLEHVLFLAGETRETINRFLSSNAQKSFLQSNRLVAQPALMHTFIQWFTRVMIVALVDPLALNMIQMSQPVVSHHKKNTSCLSLDYMQSTWGDVIVSYFFMTRGVKVLNLDGNMETILLNITGTLSTAEAQGVSFMYVPFVLFDH